MLLIRKILNIAVLRKVKYFVINAGNKLDMSDIVVHLGVAIIKSWPIKSLIGLYN